MKKIIFGIMGVVALSMVAVLTTRNSQHNELFEIQLANIEALATPELSKKCGGCSTSYNGEYCCTVYFADIDLYQKFYYPKPLF